METWVIIIIVFIIVVVLTAIITAVVVSKKKEKLITAGADEETFKQMLQNYQYYATKQPVDTILDPNYIQIYIDDYLQNISDDNPLKQLDTKIKKELNIYTLMTNSDIPLSDTEKMVFKYRKYRKHPSINIVINNIMMNISVNYIDTHIKYNVGIVSDKSDNIQFDLTDMDGVIKLIANTFNIVPIVQGVPVPQPLIRVKGVPVPIVQGTSGTQPLIRVKGVPFPIVQGTPGISVTQPLPRVNGTPFQTVYGKPNNFGKYTKRLGICNIL